MSLRQYLPSAKFAVMLGAVVLSGGLVVAAQSVTHPQAAVAQLDPDLDAQQAAQTQDWQQVLRDIQTSSGIKAPEAPDAATVNSLLTAADSPNVTTKVARTLLINLTSASSQGLGQDTPTQDKLIAQAAAQLPKGPAAPAYTTGSLTSVAQSMASLHAYGNALIVAVLAHPDASNNDVYAEVGLATDNQDAKKMADFPHRAAEYRALAADLAALPVPQTLLPLHLSLVNSVAAMAESLGDVVTVFDDPVRGLNGLKQFQSFDDEAARVFTNIGQTFGKDGILFTKDEPGAAWSILLST